MSRTLPDLGIDPRHVDWVYVARLTGDLLGPITRHPTRAEARRALAAGATINVIAKRAGISHESAAAIVGADA